MRRTRNSVAGIGFSLWILLGLTVTGAYAQDPSKQVAKETSPVFTLVGTIEGDPKIAGAVFEDPQTKKQTSYRVGDVVNGATIVEIRHQQVVLKHGEEIVVVRITGGSPSERAPGDPIPVPAGDPRQARQFVISKVIPPYDPRVEKERRAVSRNEVDRFVSHFQEQLKDKMPVLITTSLGPAADLSGVDMEVLQHLSLEPTDRIVEINGMGIGSTDLFRQILEILGRDRVSVFNISVLRGEMFQPLYYTVK